MADRNLYGSVSSPSAGENVRRQLEAGDRALIGGLVRGSTSVDIDSSGNVSVTMSGSARVDVQQNWSKIDGTFLVPPGSGLQQLLEDMLANNYGGTILLGQGTHQITWTSSTIIDEDIRIVGSSPESTIINFNADNANCYFYFTGQVAIENVQFQGTGWSASGAPYMLRFNGSGCDRSYVRNCRFNEATIGTSMILINGADDIEISSCYFEDVPVSNSLYLIYILAGSHRFRVKDNYVPTCTTGYFLYVPDAAAETNDWEVTGNRVFGASGSYSACRVYLGGATTPGGAGGVNRGIVENNVIDITLSDPVTVLDIGGSNGSAYGDRGQVRVADNHFKCEYATTSKWTNNTFLVNLNLAKILFTDNHFYCRNIGYVNTAATSALIKVSQYAHDSEISDCHIGAWDCRNGIWVDCAAANAPLRLKIVDNTISALDHDGTGTGYGIYFDIGGAFAGAQGFMIHGNIGTATSAAEHTAVSSSSTTAGQRPNNGQIINNNWDNFTTIPAANFDGTVTISGNLYF